MGLRLASNSCAPRRRASDHLGSGLALWDGARRARGEVGGFRMPCAAWGAASAGPYFPRPAGCPATPEAPHLPRLAVDHIVKVY